MINCDICSTLTGTCTQCSPTYETIDEGETCIAECNPGEYHLQDGSCVACAVTNCDECADITGLCATCSSTYETIDEGETCI